MAKSIKVSVLPSLSSSPLAAERIAAAAAVATKLSTATPSHVKAAAKPSKAAAYDVIPFTAGEVAVFDACVSVEKALYEADNRRAAVVAAVKALFGADMPTYEAYKALQEAVYLQCIAAGYTGQAMRKHVSAAVNMLYGELPVSMSAAAIAKRASRPAAAPKAAKQADTLAAGNSTGGHVPTLGGETIESFIARVGMTAALAAAMRILDAIEDTKPAAADIRAAIGKLAA
jgi:hypothetical protein